VQEITEEERTIFRKAYKTTYFKEIPEEKFNLFEEWCFKTASLDVIFGKNITLCYLDTSTLKCRYQKFDQAYKILSRRN